MVSTIAPILSFTAEEIYEAMPGRKTASVHLTEIPKLDAAFGADETNRFTRVLRLRDAVLAVLERARAAKTIGQSLEADITLFGNIDDGGVDLAKLFIVSHVDVKPPDESVADSIEIEGLGRIGIAMSAARGKKCGRCWQYREEVANEGDLCARCQNVVDNLAPSDTPTA